MPVLEFKSEQEYQKIITDNKCVVVDCFADWCGPCKMIAPKYHDMSDKYTSVTFTKFDVDALEDLAQTLGVDAMPTFFLIRDGKVIDQVVGANPTALEEAIKSKLA
jgi:thioredoxin 1